MPRIPTYDRSENVAGRPQPFSTGDGYAAPGRAMQQLGDGLQKLGSGLDAALKVEQGKKDEEDRFKMNMEWLKFTSQQDLYQTDYDKKITGDGSSHVPGRMEGYDTAFGEFFGRVAPQSPRLRRELQLRGMQYRGHVQQRTSRTAEGHRDFYFSSVAEKGITGTVLPRVTYDITTARQGLDLAEGIIASAPITEQRKAQLRDRAAAAILDAWKDRAFKAYEAEGIGDPAKMVEEQLKKYGDSFKPSPTQPQKPGAPAGPVGKISLERGLFKAEGIPVVDATVPDAPYMRRVRDLSTITRVIMHGDQNTDIDRLIQYGRRVDKVRGFDANYHFYIALDGTIKQGVPLDRRANHAFRNNGDTIGIVLAGADGGRMPTPQQEAAAYRLTAALAKQFGIKQENVLGHGERPGMSIGGRHKLEGGLIAKTIREKGFRFDMLGQPSAPQQPAAAPPEQPTGVDYARGVFKAIPKPGAPDVTLKADWDTGKKQPASIRTNNPGAMYFNDTAKKWGATRRIDLADGHQIAEFPDVVSGIAAQFDRLANNPNYKGKPLSAVIATWSGQKEGTSRQQAYLKRVMDATGLKADVVVTPELLSDPKVAIPFAKAMARVEAGKDHPASDAFWTAGHQKVFGGQAPRMGLGGPPTEPPQAAAPQDQPAVPYGPEAEFEPQKPPAEGMPGAPIQVAEAPPPWVSGAPRTTTDYFARRLWLDNDKIRRQTRIVGEAFRKRREALELVAGVLAGTREFNPHDDASRKIIDKVFSETEVSKKLFAGDPTTIMRAVELGHRLNYLPKPVGEAVRGLVDHADPVKRQLGLTAAAAILARRPRAFSEVQGSAGMVKEALLFQSLRETRGMSAEDAVKHLDLMKSPEWKKLAEVRGKEAKLKADAYGESHITKIFDPSMLPNFLSPEQAKRPDLSPVTAGVMFGGNQVLIKRARELFQEHYIKTGDETVAWAATGKELKAMYGSSSVTGKRLLMRYPPEAIYPQIAQKPELMDYVNKDIQASVKKVLGKDVPLGSIYLFADAETQRSITAGQGPRYGLAYLDKESGLYKIVPGRFYIDPKGLEAVSKKQFDDARKKALEKETRAPHMLLRDAFDGAKRAVPGGQPPAAPPAKPPSPATPSRGTPEPTSTRLPGKPVRPDRSDTYVTDVPGQDEPSGPVIRPGSPLDRLWRYINPQ